MADEMNGAESLVRTLLAGTGLCCLKSVSVWRIPYQRRIFTSRTPRNVSPGSLTPPRGAGPSRSSGCVRLPFGARLA